MLAALLPFGGLHPAEKFERQPQFDYANLLQKKSQGKTIEPIALTLENGEALHGDISPDNKYLYFSNNASGNFDIYFRPLNDIITIPLLAESTNQSEPAISPSGSMLAFIDDELDPDGDIALIKVDPKETIEIYFESGQKAVKERYTGEKIYLTNSLKNRSRSKESAPAWSPNGKYIAYSSNRTASPTRYGPQFGALQNIWILPVSAPEKARQITTRGGISPAFSPDGARLVYVSVDPKDKNGDLFEVDLRTNEERRLTSGTSFDLSPTYASSNRILFTRISQDTNGDGLVNQLDNGQVMALEMSQKVAGDEPPSFEEQIETTTHPINPNNLGLFNSRYTKFLGGGVIFAQTSGENTHLFFLPETGIIPKSGAPHLQYQSALSYSDKELRTLALNTVLYSPTQTPLDARYSARANFHILTTPGYTPSEKEGSLEALSSAAASGETFARLLLDLYYIKNPSQTPEEYHFLNSPAPNLLAYLSSFIDPLPQKEGGEEAEGEARQEVAQEAPLWSHLPEFIPFAMELYAEELAKGGNEGGAGEVAKRMAIEYPAYHRNIDLLYQIAVQTNDIAVSPELLFFIDPQAHPLPLYESAARSITRRLGLQPQPTAQLHDETPEEQAPQAAPPQLPEEVVEFHTKANQTLAAAIPSEKRIQAENYLYQYLVASIQKGRKYIIEELTRTYPQAQYPKLNYIILHAQAKAAIERNDLDLAQTLITQSLPNMNVRSDLWSYRLQVLTADLYNLQGNRSHSIGKYFDAISLYKKQYADPEFTQICKTIIDYYQHGASIEESRKNDPRVFTYYRRTIHTIMALYTLGSFENEAQERAFSRFALNSFISMNNYALRSRQASPLSKDSIAASLSSIYDQYIDAAKRELITPFIFGRAHLNTLLGIQLHTYYEKSYLLNKINKETVLVLFKKAETDLQWSIYSNSSFADSYVMLGWMYQFIDDKRAALIYTGKSREGVKDFEMFSSLYDIYFPEYLFEKNIALFRKSVSFLSQKASQHILNSFYLNIANNYYLLNNHAKATEYYEKILNRKAGEFNFENELQEAQYYFHFGKSSFYTGRHDMANDLFQKAIPLYRPLDATAAAASGAKDLDEINFERAENRAILLKYLALNASEAHRYKKAFDYYSELEKLIVEYGIETRRSILHIEMARMLYLEAKSRNIASPLQSALLHLKKANSYLEAEEEVLPKKYPARGKILGFIPFSSNMVKQEHVVYGDSFFIYPLPTIHTKEYLASLQSDIYKAMGRYTESTLAIYELIRTAEEDKTPHGHGTQALVTGYMRQGELLYLRNRTIYAVEAYNHVLKMADDNPNIPLRTILKAKKNQLYLATLELESGRFSREEKLARIEKELEDLEQFSRRYIERKIQAAEESAEASEDVKLTKAEIARISKEAIADIYKVKLYSGVFLAMQAHILNEAADEKSSSAASLDDYIAIKNQAYRSYRSAIPILHGDIAVQSETLNLIDPYADRRLSLILSLNRSGLHQDFGFFEEAAQESDKAALRSEEFQAVGIIPVANIRLSEARQSLSQPSAKPLEKAAKVFQENPYLINQLPTEYQLVTNYLIEKGFENKDYLGSIYYANRKLHHESLQAIGESSLTANVDFQKEIQTYRDIERVKREIKTEIEKARLKREPSEKYEQMLAEFEKRQLEIRNRLYSGRDTAPFAVVHFSELTGKDQIEKYKKPYLYFFQNDGYTHIVSTAGGKTSYQKFQVEAASFDDYFLKLAEWQKTQEASAASSAAPTLPKEGLKMLDWMKRQNVAIVFPGKEYWDFPFSQAMGRNLPREYTFQAARMFQTNENYADDRWATLHKSALPAGDTAAGAAGGMTEKRYFTTVKTFSEIENSPYRYNALDLEFNKNLANLSPNEASSIARLFLTPLELSSVIVSGFENTPSNAPLQGGLNMMFAAQGVSRVIYTGKTRSAAKEEAEIFMGYGVAPSGESGEAAAKKTPPSWNYSGNTDYLAPYKNGEELNPGAAKVEAAAARSCSAAIEKSRVDSDPHSGIERLLRCQNLLDHYRSRHLTRGNSAANSGAQASPLPEALQNLNKSSQLLLIQRYVQTGQYERAKTLATPAPKGGAPEANQMATKDEQQRAAFFINELIYGDEAAAAFGWINEQGESLGLDFTLEEKRMFIESYLMVAIRRGDKSVTHSAPEPLFDDWRSDYFSEVLVETNGIEQIMAKLTPQSERLDRWVETISGAMQTGALLQMSATYPSLGIDPWAKDFSLLVDNGKSASPLPAWLQLAQNPGAISVNDFNREREKSGELSANETLRRQILEIQYRIKQGRWDIVETLQEEFVEVAKREERPYALYTLMWLLMDEISERQYNEEVTRHFGELLAYFSKEANGVDDPKQKSLSLPYGQKSYLELLGMAEAALFNPALLKGYAENKSSKNLHWSQGEAKIYNSLVYLGATFHTAAASEVEMVSLFSPPAKGGFAEAEWSRFLENLDALENRPKAGGQGESPEGGAPEGGAPKSDAPKSDAPPGGGKLFSPERVRMDTQREMAFLFQYYVDKKMYDKALALYLYYDRKILSEGEEPGLSMIGLVATFPGEYFLWTRQGGKAVITKINEGEVSSFVQSNPGKVVYLPEKSSRGDLLGGRLYSMTLFSPEVPEVPAHVADPSRLGGEEGEAEGGSDKEAPEDLKSRAPQRWSQDGPNSLPIASVLRIELGEPVNAAVSDVPVTYQIVSGMGGGEAAAQIYIHLNGAMVENGESGETAPGYHLIFPKELSGVHIDFLRRFVFIMENEPGEPLEVFKKTGEKLVEETSSKAALDQTVLLIR